MTDKNLRKELIKLAHSNPDLRPHLLPILKEGAFTNPMSNTWSGKLAMVLVQYCDGSITTAQDLQAAAAALLKAALEMKKDAASFDESTPPRQIADLTGQYHEDLVRKLKPVL